MTPLVILGCWLLLFRADRLGKVRTRWIAGITGLAASVGHTVSAKGWKLAGTDNWDGPIPATTVYYPPKLAGAARVLAHDLGIGRLKPAEKGTMSNARLTVILTGRLR